MRVKVFISVDIEGCTGVSSFSQCGRPSEDYPDYPFSRRMLTHDVNAAIRGARAAGASYILIKDGHATCKNLLIDELEPGVGLISGRGSEWDGMMDGIDSSFAAAFLVGYHGMAGAENAFMEHALVGGLHRLWINGARAGEIAASGAVAGAYGVPLVLVTSDDAGCAEALSLCPQAQVFSTKEAFGKYMGRMLDPSETWPGIEAAAKRAVENRAANPPIRLREPVMLRFSFRTTEETDLAATHPSVARIDGYTLELLGETFLAAHQELLSIFALSIQGRSSES